MSANLEIPGHIALVTGNGGLTKALITTPWSQAEIYLHGAHITHFQKTGEPPLLFMSAASQFAEGAPIRGGVPLIFPWFGPREGFPAHGYARTRTWELQETAVLSNGAVTLRFALPEAEGYQVEFLVTLTDTLQMELSVCNRSAETQQFETCLHTYFHISDISAISILGLEGIPYLDKVASTQETDSGQIQISGEVDRVYANTPATVELLDLGFKRSIRIEKSGSASTVVWNPWIEKSKRMPDFGDDEYPHMVCVESGNVGENTQSLAPGETAVLWVRVTSV